MEKDKVPYSIYLYWRRINFPVVRKQYDAIGQGNFTVNKHYSYFYYEDLHESLAKHHSHQDYKIELELKQP